MNRSKDYYKILGVIREAEDVVIQGAYRALAQRYHPDKFPDGAAESYERMAEINEAYRILSDATLRAQYDQNREPLSFANDGSNLDGHMAFALEQFRPFAEKLHEWGYSPVKISEFLVQRGASPAVAGELARMFSGSE